MKNEKTKVLRILLTAVACLFEGAALLFALRMAGQTDTRRTAALWLLLLLPFFLFSLVLMYTGGGRGLKRHTAVVTLSLLLLLTTVGLSAGILYNAMQAGEGSAPGTGGSWLMLWNGHKAPVFVPPVSVETDTGNGSGSGEGGGGEGGSGEGEGGGGSGPQVSSAPMLDGSGQIGRRMDESIGGAGNQTAVFRLSSDADGPLYLQFKSFGAYLGQGWAEAAPSSVMLEDGSSPRSLAAENLHASGAATHILFMERLTGDFAVPYHYIDADKTCSVTDTVVSAGTEAEYSFTFCRPDGGWNVAEAANADREYSYRMYVCKTYLEGDTVDPSAEAYFRSVIGENKLDIPVGASVEEKLEIIGRAAAWVRNAAVYNTYYDRTLDSEEDIALQFLTVYKEGICSHFATAGTLLFRAMGLPARYTIGYLANIKSGIPCEVTTEDAHAWVEVYLDGIGWIPVEVTGGSESEGSGSGSGSDKYENLSSLVKLTPKLTEQRYNGQSVAPLQELSGFDALARLGYTYTCTVSGMADELGYTPTEITALTIFDSRGEDVTNQLHPTVGTGFIHIYYDKIRTGSFNIGKDYDGLPVTVPDEHCFYISGNLLDGHFVTFTGQTVSGEVGTRPVLYDVRIEDGSGADCTDLYRIVREAGTLTVTAPLLRIRAADAVRQYDGTPLVCPDFTVIEGSLLEGDVLEACPVIGSQTSIGRSDNIIDLSGIRIVNADGEDVTLCYRIEAEKGTLRVTP